MLKTLLVEDNDALRHALNVGLEATADVRVVGEVKHHERSFYLITQRFAWAAPPSETGVKPHHDDLSKCYRIERVN